MSSKLLSTAIAGNETAPDLSQYYLSDNYHNGLMSIDGITRALPPMPTNTVAMNEDQKLLFRINLALSPPIIPQLLAKVDKQLEVGLYLKTSCGANNSCAQSLKRPLQKNSYSIQIYAPHFDVGGAGRYIILHEIGHVLHHEFISNQELDHFMTLFEQHPHWQDCYLMPENVERSSPEECVDETEIFADQFAFWATGQTGLSGYAIPALSTPEEFGNLFIKTVE